MRPPWVRTSRSSFGRTTPRSVVDANERMLKVLGLLPADASLEDLYISLLSGVVAGLYNPKDKTLYVVSRSGGLGPSEKTTFAHEYTHALQDQNFDLTGLHLDAPGQGDQGDGPPGTRRGRRDPGDDPLADRQPDPGRPPAGVGRVTRSRGDRTARERCRRSFASRCSFRTRAA